MRLGDAAMVQNGCNDTLGMLQISKSGLEKSLQTLPGPCGGCRGPGDGLSLEHPIELPHPLFFPTTRVLCPHPNLP